MKQYGKVAVLFGGPSSEREISLMSGQAVLQALRARGVDAHAFDPATRPLSDLAVESFQCAFIALHGRFGEDGTVQGALETMDIPYTGSGVMASALAMDKWRTKMLWLQGGLPTPAYRVLNANTDWAKVIADLGAPVMVKPVHEGSSIGISKATDAATLESAYAVAAALDDVVIAEQFITGAELTAAVLGEQPLPLVRIEAPSGNYDYQNKYFSDETRYLCPSGLPADLEARIQKIALEAFKLLGCRGWARADVMLDAKNQPWLLEMNTSPGMTGHSLVPMAAREAGIEFEDLCLRILDMATERGAQG
ncbi:MAG TPA: D-alanine--D-alanine ligase [Burkholderiales bacterium]|nr:D-alanine--D-alanine ligase [Burkholderiales bacterium]